ncbi:MAG: acetyltransferase [Synergistaceae bacterium]|jgi:sugar O-acyltransferase (sialic acid O-acetyltransferase NeuD family)|nr:acetyltransferase [Synergistaceae bacterium]
MSEGHENIIIYGAGGLGREILQMARITLGREGARILGYVDDGVEPGAVLNDYEVLGGMGYLEQFTEPVSVILGFSAQKAKEKIFSHLRKNPNISFPNIIHPNASVSEYASLGKGIVVASACIISLDAVIGDCVFLNCGAMVGHDTTIGACTSVMPLAAISGNVTIGERCLIGVQSAIRQGVNIGSDCTVGMGSIVFNDVANEATVLGNPARRIV